jgi:FecR protein
VRFQKGARIVMEGPASLEIISANSARLMNGKLTAKVPESAKGFQIVTPKGKVVDLGTEFAMAVEADGTTDVYVYSGKVEAYADAKKPQNFLSLQEKQAARIDVEGVALKQEPDSKPFVRDIPVIVPRTLMLDFNRSIEGTIRDKTGLGTGLTHRLPGTGRDLKPNDDNLFLNLAEGQLEVKTTKSDINTQFLLKQGEYLGIKLTDLGFTGTEDFALTVVVPHIPELKAVGQFGLYAGVRSNRNIRGGLISTSVLETYRQLLVKNPDGNDVKPHYVEGEIEAGADLRMTLRREGKQFALTVENLTTGNKSIVEIPQPSFLEGQRDMYVGFFAANPRSDARRVLTLKEFKATVWTQAP